MWWSRTPTAESAELGAAAAAGDMDGELLVCSAAHLYAWGLVFLEGGPKCDPNVRAEVEECFLRTGGLWSKRRSAEALMISI